MEDELLDVQHGLEDVQILDVTSEAGDVLLKTAGTDHALLDSVELQVTGQTVDETSSEVGHSHLAVGLREDFLGGEDRLISCLSGEREH